MKPIKAFLKMKKAFSFLELIFALVLMSFVFLALLRGFENLSFKTQEQTKNSLSQDLILMSKILRKCIEIKLLNNEISCLLEDKDNIFLMQKTKVFLGSSGLILEENKNFYAPKAHFLPKNSNSVFQNEQDLRYLGSNSLYLYALLDKKIYKTKPISEQNLSFENDAFTGFYKLALAHIRFFLQDEKLFYEYEALYDKPFSFVLVQNVAVFDFFKNNEILEIKLCLKDGFCLEKGLLLEN